MEGARIINCIEGCHRNRAITLPLADGATCEGASAVELGAALSERYAGRVCAVHSSDLSRASTTAASAAAALGDLPVATHERLRERKLGPFEGHDEQHNSTQNALAWGRFRRGMSVAGVESCDDVYARASAALVEIAAAHDGKTVVVVTHGGVIVTLAERLTVVGQHVPPIRNCSITALRAPRGGAPFEAWRVESIGDASHLSDGAAAGVANADVR